MVNRFSLRGRRALVTGSTQGVGAAIATALARAGADVCLHGLKDDAFAEETLAKCRDCGVEVALVVGDLTDSGFVAALPERAMAILPGIDLLVNNAGTFIDLPFLEMTAERYRKTMSLNVDAPFFLTQWFARRWVADGVEGRVLMTGSINGLLAEPDHVAYDASKGAVAARQGLPGCGARGRSACRWSCRTGCCQRHGKARLQAATLVWGEHGDRLQADRIKRNHSGNNTPAEGAGITNAAACSAVLCRPLLLHRPRPSAPWLCYVHVLALSSQSPS